MSYTQEEWSSMTMSEQAEAWDAMTDDERRAVRPDWQPPEQGAPAIQETEPVAPEPEPAAAQPKAKKVTKTEFAGAGALVQLLGLIALFFFFPVGILIGIACFLIGSQMSRSWRCGTCRGRIDKQARICPHCRAELE